MLQFILERENSRVISCATSEEGLKLAGQHKFLAIVLDHRLADISGLEICRRIRAHDQQTLIIFYTGSAYPKDREKGIAAGADAYLVKP